MLHSSGWTPENQPQYASIFIFAKTNSVPSRKVHIKHHFREDGLLPFDDITSEEPLYQIIKKFNYVKYIGKVIIRKIMSSCLGVADFCQTYNQ